MSVIDALKHRVHESFKSAAEVVMPVRVSSGFREHGVLTPEEFVAAGDFLVRTCPTWSWDGGKEKKRRAFLPPDKQYLVTKNVPCLRRADIDEDKKSTILQGFSGEDELEDEWIAPQASTSGLDAADADVIEDMDSSSKNKNEQSIGVSSSIGPSTSGDDEDDDDVPDMDDFDDDNIVDDVASLNINEAKEETQAEDMGNVLKTRTYDLSITYDKFYQTPRMWLVGYDEQNNRLQPIKCLDDVSHEHARKTVTIDEHPCLDVMAASIHPCKHANVMKRITDMMDEGGKVPVVEHYLFLFLKFIASIVPTIEYDYTIAVGTAAAKSKE